jgi:hypothetical protein
MHIITIFTKEFLLITELIPSNKILKNEAKKYGTVGILLFQLHYNEFCCCMLLKMPVKTLEEMLFTVFCARYN